MPSPRRVVESLTKWYPKGGEKYVKRKLTLEREHPRATHDEKLQPSRTLPYSPPTMVLKIRATREIYITHNSRLLLCARARSYLFVGVVDTHSAGNHFVQADGHGDDEIFGFDDVHPSDERYVADETLSVKHQMRRMVRRVGWTVARIIRSVQSPTICASD